MNTNQLFLLSNSLLSNGELVTLLDGYKSPEMKIAAMERNQEIVRLKRGLYVVNGEPFGKPISRPLCSNHLYGPSYLSFQWALSFYGLIPERVFAYTAATIKRSREFSNVLGHFSYHQVPTPYFSLGITMQTIDGATFLMASPEKALCDMILSDSYLPGRSVVGLKHYLEEDLRFEIDELRHFDADLVAACAEQGRKRNIIRNLFSLMNTL